MTTPGKTTTTATTAAIAKFFDKNLMLFVSLAIIAGVIVGVYAPNFAKSLKSYINFTLFLMLYPMMVGIKVEEMAQAFVNVRAMGWSLVLNFIVSPLVGFLLARTLLAHYPAFAVAILLLSATPCAGMVAGWTGLAKGNVALAVAIVAVSLALSIVTIPITMAILAGSIVQLNAWAMFQGTLVVILLPMVAGWITRWIIIRGSGERGFAAVKLLLGPISMLGMYSIVFISVAMGAPQIIRSWHAIFVIVPALLLFYAVQFFLSIRTAAASRLAPPDATALVYGVTGKNISLAIGLATQFFSPLTVVMLAVNPLIQIPSMAWFLSRVRRPQSRPKRPSGS